MSTIIRLVSRLKWLGLLGLPQFLSDNPIWKYLWLFWLFGIVEMVLRGPMMIESLGQLLALIWIPISNRPLPDKDNYPYKIRYSLPFEGGWTVINGGVTEKLSHSWHINPQRYAYDFIKISPEGKSYKGDEKNLENYYCYGQKILAPADGIVVKVVDKYDNSKIMKGNGLDPSAKSLSGNHIIIKHSENEYSLLAHLKPESIKVKPGEKVKRYQELALCGNSGNTTEPHLHFQIQNGKSFIFSAGIPICFEEIEISDSVNYHLYDDRSLEREMSIRETCQFIQRGDRVENLYKISVDKL